MDSINKSICKNNFDFKIQSQNFFLLHCILFIEGKYKKKSQFNFVKKNIKFALIFEFIFINFILIVYIV